MDTSSFDSRISELESRKEQLTDQMEDASQTFLAYTKQLAQGLVRQRVEQAVTSKPEVAKSIGMEGLKQLKAESRELTERAPDLIEQRVNRDELWTHRKEPENPDQYEVSSRYDYLGHRAPTELHDAIRHALGPVKELLVKHGFDTYEGYDYHERRKFGYHFDWTEEMKLAVREYATLNKEYIQVSTELQTVKRQKEQFEVKSMWDEA